MTERRHRFLFLSGLAVVASSVLAPAWSSAATTPPPAARPDRGAAHGADTGAPRPAPTADAPTAGDHARRRPTTLPTETTLLPTTTTEAPAPARAAVVYRRERRV